jgi:hypothetical protein
MASLEPRGIRLNNPGNLRHGDKWQGMVDDQPDRSPPPATTLVSRRDFPPPDPPPATRGSPWSRGRRRVRAVAPRRVDVHAGDSRRALLDYVVN